MSSQLDQNKTALTHRITATAAAWLDGHGFKPVETEVPVGGGWVADLASFSYPTPTELTKMHLIEKKTWPSGGTFVDQEAAMQLNYKYGPILTIVVEVKTSPADFKKDLDTKFATRSYYPAHLCGVAYPCGMIERKDIPEGWFGMPVTKGDNPRVSKLMNPPHPHQLHPMNTGDICDLIAMIAIRRDHRTRYTASRDWLRMYRARQNEVKKLNTLNYLLNRLGRWLIGQEEKYFTDHIKTFADVWGYTTGRNKLPPQLIDLAEQMDAVRREVLERRGDE